MREGEKRGLKALMEWEFDVFGAGDHISVGVVHVQFDFGARLEEWRTVGLWVRDTSVLVGPSVGGQKSVDTRLLRGKKGVRGIKKSKPNWQMCNSAESQMNTLLCVKRQNNRELNGFLPRLICGFGGVWGNRLNWCPTTFSTDPRSHQFDTLAARLPFQPITILTVQDIGTLFNMLLMAVVTYLLAQTQLCRQIKPKI